MDPTTNLRRQLELVEEIIADSEDPQDWRDQSAESVELAELVTALHTWMQQGGHLPEQ